MIMHGQCKSVLNIGSTGGLPGDQCYNVSYKNVEAVPKIAEKPFIVFDEDENKYGLLIPGYETDKLEPGMSDNYDLQPFERVYVASEEDDASLLNDMLNHVDFMVLQPGVYKMDKPLKFKRDKQVLLGIGMPSLVSTNGNAVIEVLRKKGVRIAGIIMEIESDKPTKTLLEWGVETHGVSDDANEPGVLSDVFARVAPKNSKQTITNLKNMIQINTPHMIIDNTWLWRSTSDKNGPIANLANHVETGLQVDSDDVTVYGLNVDQTLSNLVNWNGNDGRIYSSALNLPFDLDSTDYMSDNAHALKVADDVTSHLNIGTAVYLNTKGKTVESAIKAPVHSDVSFFNVYTKDESGSSTISHAVNSKGGAATKGKGAFLCELD